MHTIRALWCAALLAPALAAQPSAPSLPRPLIDSLVDAQITSAGDDALYARLCGAPRAAGQQVVVGRVIPAEGSAAGAMVWLLTEAGVSTAPITVDSTGMFRLCGLVLLGRGATLFGAIALPDGRAHLAVRGQGALRDPVFVHVLGVDPPAVRPATTDGPSSLLGVVYTTSGAALPNATVSLEQIASAPRARSGPDGAFSVELPGTLGDGNTLLAVRALRHHPVQVRVSRAIASASIVLEPIPTALDTVVTRDVADRTISGFDQRRLSRNGGTYITEEEIHRRQPQKMSQLLRGIPGLVVETQQKANVAQVLISSMRQQGSSPERQGGCLVSVFVDGALLGDATGTSSGLDFLDNVVPPSEVLGIEVHRGLSSLPPTFQRTGKDQCGAILVWTKR
ncbi:MAG: TonB-dependent receptor plug domain-containing protein [Gemmatimonadaceae bacterium]|jgi:hypothetical protein|nr:TonB-dependent receptor plug domain-containing protein [Gemmatimonadaceae bacterium]